MKLSNKNKILIFFVICSILIYIFAVIPMANDCEDKVKPKNATCEHEMICMLGSCEDGDVCPLPCNSTLRWVMLTLMIEGSFIFVIYLTLLILYCIFNNILNFFERKNEIAADYDEI